MFPVPGYETCSFCGREDPSELGAGIEEDLTLRLRSALHILLPLLLEAAEHFLQSSWLLQAFMNNLGQVCQLLTGDYPRASFLRSLLEPFPKLSVAAGGDENGFTEYAS